MDPFVAEIRIFPFNFAPKGWAFCDGQLLPISQATALFSLVGTYYGGNGTSNFALPNLQGCAALNNGQGAGLSQRDIGETSGSSMVTLLTTEMPAHSHPIRCVTTPGNSVSPSLNAFGSLRRGKPPAYAALPGSAVAMSPSAVSITGGNQPHNNLQPFLTLNFCISMQGVFPPRS